LTSAGECVIECDNGRGARMRIHWKRHDAPDLAALGRCFWDAP
jgi:hypothetical protein